MYYLPVGCCSQAAPRHALGTTAAMTATCCSPPPLPSQPRRAHSHCSWSVMAAMAAKTAATLPIDDFLLSYPSKLQKNLFPIAGMIKWATNYIASVMLRFVQHRGILSIPPIICCRLASLLFNLVGIEARVTHGGLIIAVTRLIRDRIRGLTDCRMPSPYAVWLTTCLRLPGPLGECSFLLSKSKEWSLWISGSPMSRAAGISLSPSYRLTPVPRSPLDP